MGSTICTLASCNYRTIVRYSKSYAKFEGKGGEAPYPNLRSYKNSPSYSPTAQRERLGNTTTKKMAQCICLQFSLPKFKLDNALESRQMLLLISSPG